MTDYISRADAIDAVKEILSGNVYWDYVCDAVKALKALPSADAVSREEYDKLLNDSIWQAERMKKQLEYRAELSADVEPTVVRCKTMIPYGDFREWAKRIREDNPNVIVIPFDAEVVSADSVHGEWLYVENEPYSECSKCGRYIDDLDEDKYAYCPYCGARMENTK